MRKKWIPILLGLLLTVFTLWLLITNAGLVDDVRERLDSIVYDNTLTSILLVKTKPPKTPIVIVDVDDKSINKEGRWPWPRERLAELVNKIQKAGALVIAFDVTFSQPEVNIADKVLAKIQEQHPHLNPGISQLFKSIKPFFNYDAKFAESLGVGENVLGVLFHNDKHLGSMGLLPPPLLAINPDDQSSLLIPTMARYSANIPILQNAAKHGGFVTSWPDQDGILRSTPLVLRYENDLYPSLALEATRLFLLIDKVEVQTVNMGSSKAVEAIKFGDALIPTDAYGRLLLRYRGPVGSFPYLSATDIFNDEVDLKPLKNALVFIGSTSLALGDLHATPIDPGFPGVEIQANVANTLIDGKFLYQPSWASGAEKISVAMMGVIAALLFAFFGPITIIILTLLGMVSLFVGDFWLMKESGLILSPIMPVFLILVIAILNLIYGFFFEYRAKKEIKVMFGQYVPSAQVELMSEDPKQYTFEGETKNLTVLFCDIRNFTTIAEPLNANEVKNMLNRFFTEMTSIIFKYKGTIDKYIGDMVMAFWGAPLEDHEHVKNALTAALEMMAKKEVLKKEFAESGLPEINIGIGLNTGLMYVGDMGSEYRRSYTVLGDAVNLASRLEDLTKKYHVEIIVSETAQQVGEKDFVFRKLDRVTVKGKAVPIDIFQLICRKQEAEKALLDELTAFENALKNYYAQKWTVAKEALSRLLNNPAQLNNHVYQMYWDRIAEMENKKLPDGWDGVYQWQEK